MTRRSGRRDCTLIGRPETIPGAKSTISHSGGSLGGEWEQTWECYQAYDNATYPGLVPGDPSWYTFNRPLHGKTKETARPFVPVQGAHDMYRTGEYMIFTDGKVYRCKQDTNFSPTDYAQAWEVQE